MNTTLRIFLLLAALVIGMLRWAQADAVRNGNELALNLTRWDAAKRTELAKTRAGMLHTFRYLRIQNISLANPDTGAITLTTIEPSSDAKVIFPVTTRISLELVRTLTTNDAVAVNGRVVKISSSVPPTI